MFEIRPVSAPVADGTWLVPVDRTGPMTGIELPDDLRAEAVELHATTGAQAGDVTVLPRPLRHPAKVLLTGVGDGDEKGWRAAGAAAMRVALPDERLQVTVPAGAAPAAVRGLAEGLGLAGYHQDGAPGTPRSAEVVLIVEDIEGYADSLDEARTTVAATHLARDLTNAPASIKNPAWLADRIVAEVGRRTGLTITVREPEQLAAEGFGGIIAVGGGSASGPRLVELSWSPEGATRHVVLVGKGITFDTGGISIKPREAMKLMRKDMAGAAAVLAATLGAADLGLPVRVTALAPLAENAVSGSAFRPGDVLTHWDGTTSETTNSDAEGRLVLADVLAYAVAELAPDVIIDLATLTGANAVALGKRTAALYSHDDTLAEELTAAGAAAGEQLWRMPLPDDYVEYMHSDIADRHSSPARGAGSVVAALYLQEFLGDSIGRWAHLDMSAPSWADSTDGELSTGATGWGARTLLRYLG